MTESPGYPVSQPVAAHRPAEYAHRVAIASRTDRETGCDCIWPHPQAIQPNRWRHLVFQSGLRGKDAVWHGAQRGAAAFSSR